MGSESLVNAHSSLPGWGAEVGFVLSASRKVWAVSQQSSSGLAFSVRRHKMGSKTPWAELGLPEQIRAPTKFAVDPPKCGGDSPCGAAAGESEVSQLVQGEAEAPPAPWILIFFATCDAA